MIEVIANSIWNGWMVCWHVTHTTIRNLTWLSRADVLLRINNCYTRHIPSIHACTYEEEEDEKKLYKRLTLNICRDNSLSDSNQPWIVPQWIDYRTEHYIWNQINEIRINPHNKEFKRHSSRLVVDFFAFKICWISVCDAKNLVKK